MTERVGDTRACTQPLRKPGGCLSDVGQSLRHVMPRCREPGDTMRESGTTPLRRQPGDYDAHEVRTICVVGLRHSVTHADVVATAEPALRTARARAPHLVEPRQSIDYPPVLSPPPTYNPHPPHI